MIKSQETHKLASGFLGPLVGTHRLAPGPVSPIQGLLRVQGTVSAAGPAPGFIQETLARPPWAWPYPAPETQAGPRAWVYQLFLTSIYLVPAVYGSRASCAEQSRGESQSYPRKPSSARGGGSGVRSRADLRRRPPRSHCYPRLFVSGSLPV